MLLVYASLSSAAETAAPAKPDLARGQQIASSVCAACHGPDGNSVAPTFPVLAGQHADYIAAQLEAFKSGARPNDIMKGMAAGLSPEDMRNVATWFESRKPAPHFAHEKALVDRGQQIWRGGVPATEVPACAGCHGPAGHGVPAQFPRLAGQYADLSLGWLKAFAAGTRPNAVMGPIASKLSENDMKALAEYISGLR
ncbi:MAG TPA: c-type cytochrome [Usitatibacter sp.]|nr:c-type cytochrome [Usitatibacter sp.]